MIFSNNIFSDSESLSTREQLDAALASFRINQGRSPEELKLESIEENVVRYFSFHSLWGSKEITDPKKSGGDIVAIVPINGVMQKNPAYYYPSTSTAEVSRIIKELDADNLISAIVLMIDSGGGQVKGTYELGETIRKCKKPIISAVDTCCSAAYWVASQSDEIFAITPTAAIGSIGVITQHTEYSRMLNELGISMQFITSTGDEEKAYGNPVEPLSEEAKQSIVDRLDSTRDTFHKVIKSGRKDKLVTGSLTPKVYAPTAAKELGLIDGLKNLDSLVSYARTAGRKYKKEQKNTQITKINNNNNMSFGIFSKFMGETSPKITEPVVLSPEAASELYAKLDSLTNSEKELTEKKVSLEASIKNLTGEKNDLMNKVSDLDSANVKLNEDNATLQNELDTATAQVSDLEAKIVGLQTQLEAAKSESDEKLVTEISDLKTRVEEVEADNQALRTNLDKSESEKSQLNAKVESLEGKLTASYAEYNTLAKKVGEAEKHPAKKDEENEDNTKFSGSRNLRDMPISEAMNFFNRTSLSLDRVILK